MAKTPTPATREPIAARGQELLALIAGAEGGVLMLTQVEGAEAVNAGYAVVDTSRVEGDTAAVSLTDAGRAALTGSGGSATKYEIESGVEMPTEKQRRGRTGGYPFDMLEVGQSFHVAKDKENSDPASRLASSVSGARARYSIETGETETVSVNQFQRTENGKSFAKDAEGKRIVIGQEIVTRAKKTVVRDFMVKAVGANDPKGEGARVWRTK